MLGFVGSKAIGVKYTFRAVCVHEVQFWLTDNGATFTPAAFQPWPQFAGLDVSEQDPSRIVGGLQDNGSQRSWNSSG